jgi:hypothetical protein
MEEELLRLVEKHWPALRAAGLASDTAVQIWRATGKRGHGGGDYFVEMFEWKDVASSNIAHQTPAVMAVWEPMGAVMESMDIAKVERLR